MRIYNIKGDGGGVGLEGETGREGKGRGRCLSNIWATLSLFEVEFFKFTNYFAIIVQFTKAT